MNIIITNYYYQVNGTKHWFVRFSDAIDHLMMKYPNLYKGLIDPENYIHIVKQDIYGNYLHEKNI